MKLLALLVLCVVAAAYAQDKYDAMYDDFDFTEILGNERLLNSHVKCLVGKGPCTPDAKKLKDVIPEILETTCAKCTDKQKEVGKEVANEVKTKYPELWNELVSAYDADGKYQEAFKDFLVG